MSNNSRTFCLLFVIIAMAGIFYGATLREGHDWGGDFSMYIHHAKNIAEGKEYTDIGFIPNPQRTIAPYAYPPVFPLLLVPLYLLFGLNIEAMKFMIILFFLMALAVMFFTFKNKLSSKYALMIVAVLAFNPLFWSFKDNILSDIPFIFFLYTGFFIIERAYKPDFSKKLLLPAFIIALSAYLTYGTRMVGGLIMIGFLLYDIVFARRLRMLAILSLGIFSVLVCLQGVVSGGASLLLELKAITFDPNVISANFWEYFRRMAGFWDNDFSLILQCILVAIVSPLAIIGFWLRLKEKITIFEIFSLLYVAILLVYSFREGQRFLLPLFPLYLYYAFSTLWRLEIKYGRRVGNSILSVLAITILISYGSFYARIPYGPLDVGVGLPQAQEMFGYIRGNTKESDIFIFAKPRVLSLFTGRSASVWHRTSEDAKLFEYFSQHNATHLVLNTTDTIEKDILGSFVERNRHSFKNVYTNSQFIVYEIIS